MIKIFLAILLVQVAICQETTTDQPEAENALETAACIFGCLDSFERKGVEGTVESSETNGCNGLDLESLISSCDAYLKAGTCIDGCVKSPTKTAIIAGLQYICVDHLADFKKYMPCYVSKCSAMEAECGHRCGMLSEAELGWWNQLGINNKSTSDQQDETPVTEVITTSSPVLTTEASAGDDSDSMTDPIGTCQFVKCYVNCSRPIMEKECGRDAFELLKVTSKILVSFVITPLDETTNITSWDTTGSCEGFVNAQALTARSGATQTAFNFMWSFLLTPLILLKIVNL